jgi:hypothetical protein
VPRLVRSPLRIIPARRPEQGRTSAPLAVRRSDTPRPANSTAAFGCSVFQVTFRPPFKTFPIVQVCQRPALPSWAFIKRCSLHLATSNRSMPLHFSNSYYAASADLVRYLLVRLPSISGDAFCPVVPSEVTLENRMCQLVRRRRSHAATIGIVPFLSCHGWV